MKLGLRVPACEPALDVAAFCARAETSGFDGVWLPDSQLLHRDVWVTMGVVARETERIFVGTNVTNPLTRNPTVTASAAQTLAELSGDRFILGLGAGESSVIPMGVRPARLAEIRSAVEMMRTLWDGRWVGGTDGTRFRMRAAAGRRIPVYMGASRPRMLQLAGEMAEGVIIVAGITDSSIRYAMSNIEAGAARVGRDVTDIDLAFGAYVYVTDDAESVMEQALPYAATYALRYQGLERDFGVRIPDGFDVRVSYPDLIHAEDWGDAIEKTRWVPDEILKNYCDTFAIIGNADYVLKRVMELEQLGIRNLYIRGFESYSLPEDTLAAFTDIIIPAVRQGKSRAGGG